MNKKIKIFDLGFGTLIEDTKITAEGEEQKNSVYIDYDEIDAIITSLKQVKSNHDKTSRVFEY